LVSRNLLLDSPISGLNVELKLHPRLRQLIP
jgi:hypothetical protein